MDRETWLAERRKGLGGSDISVVVMGERHPFTTPQQLWEDKMGLSTDNEETPAMRRGTVLEPIIAGIYSAETGRTLRRCNKILQHPEHYWMLGNIDRLITLPCEGKSTNGILELKCPGRWAFDKIKREGVAEYYQWQLQHYLAVKGYEWGSFGIFNADLWELLYIDVDRNEEMIEEIIEKGRAFWDHVENGTPLIEKCARPLTKSDVKPLKGNGSAVQIDSETWKEATELLRRSRGVIKEAKELEDSAKDQLKDMMIFNGAQLAEGHGLRVVYKETEGSEKFDYKSFLKQNQDIADRARPYFSKGEASTYFRATFIDQKGGGEE